MAKNVANLTIGISANTAQLTSGLNQASVQINAFAKGIGITGVALGNLAADGIQRVIAGLRDMVGLLAESTREAGDFEETMNRFNAVFKGNSEAVEEWATGLANAVGRFRGDVIEGATSFQSFFVGLGFGGDQAAGLSQQLTQLAIDFASFNNLSDEEALERFISALSGSSEVLDRFGVNIRQSAIEQELLRRGIDKSWTSVTEQEKAIARLSIIMRAMGDQGAIGDAERTSGSFANQMRALTAAITEAKVSIGQELIPVILQGLPPAVEAIKSLTAAGIEFGKTMIPNIEDTKQSLTEFVDSGKAILPGLANGLQIVISQMEVLASVTGVVWSTFLRAFGAIEEVAKLLGVNVNIGLMSLADKMAQSSVALMKDSAERLRAGVTGTTGDAISEALDTINREVTNFTPVDLTPPKMPAPDVTAGGGGQTAQEIRDQLLAQIDKDFADKWRPIADRLKQSIRSPFEVLVDELRDVWGAFDAGFMNWDQYNKLLDKMAADFAKVNEAAIISGEGIGAVTAGSFEAFSAIQAANRQRDVFASQGAADFAAGKDAERAVADALKVAQGIVPLNEAQKNQDERSKVQEKQMGDLLDWTKRQDNASNEQLDWLKQAVGRLDDIVSTFEDAPPVRVVGANG